MLMQSASVDILCIQDTRIEPGEWLGVLKKEARELLGPGGSIFVATVQPRVAGSKGANVGGQVILKSPRLRGVCQFWYDESLLGAVCCLDYKVGRCDVRIVSMYVPPFGRERMGGHDYAKGNDDKDGEDMRYTGRMAERITQYTSEHRGGNGRYGVCVSNSTEED